MRRVGILFLLLCVATGSTRAADAPSQKFVVFFQEWSAALDDPAQSVITQAAEWVKTHPGNVAHVNGFADPTGSKRANALLSDLRAQMVVDQLQTELQKSRDRITAVEKEKESLHGRLEETNSKLEKAQSELDKSKGAERQVRDQLEPRR